MENYIYISELDIELSNHGNIKRLNKKTNSYNKIKLAKDAYGYHRIHIKGKAYKVHRLVAYYFISNNIENLTVNHKDFNKQNNKVSNLELISCSDNVLHYINNVKKNKSSSKVLGVGFHKGINKWTARVNYLDERFSVGTFDTEQEAIEAVNSFNNNPRKLMIGKGKSNIGKTKYSFDDDIAALKLADKIGLIKAGEITGMGSTRISLLRKKYNLKYESGRVSSQIDVINNIKQSDL